MSHKELVTLVWGVEAGRVTVGSAGRLRFAYTGAGPLVMP